MPRVVGVRFRQAGKIYYFEPGSDILEQGKRVIVETARGQEIGMVVIPEKEVPEEELVLPLKKVIRIAVEADFCKDEENRQKEAAAFARCRQKIIEHSLDMKLVSV